MFDNKLNSTQFPEMFDDFLTAERNPYTGQRCIMDRTDRPHYDKFCKGIVECLKPANPLEQLLAFSIATDYWRLNRTRNIEDGTFAASHPNPTSDFGPTPIDKQIAAAQTSAFLCRQPDFKFLSTYQMRIERLLNRHKAELRQLQAERRKLENQPDYQPDLGPRNDGFVISNPPDPAPEAPHPAETITEEPTRVRTAANQSEPAAPVSEASQQSGLIPTNTEAPGAAGNPPQNGFAYSKLVAQINGTPPTSQKDPQNQL